MRRANGNGGTMWLTRTYNFIDKDPECDVFRTLYQKEHIREVDLAMLAGLSVTTVKNLFGGETRSPRHSTFGKLAGAMGYKYGLQRDEVPDYEAEIPKARDEFKAHKDALRKKRERAAARTNRK
jgi:transcriptional regulator with XRE-family HTH domain